MIIITIHLVLVDSQTYQQFILGLAMLIVNTLFKISSTKLCCLTGQTYLKDAYTLLILYHSYILL